MAKSTTAVPTATAPATIQSARFDAKRLWPPDAHVVVDPPGFPPRARNRAITSAADWGRDAVSFARQSATSDSHSGGTDAIETCSSLRRSATDGAVRVSICRKISPV